MNARSIKDAAKHMDDWGSGVYEMFIVEVGPCYDSDGELIDNYVCVKIWGQEFPAEREKTCN